MEKNETTLNEKQLQAVRHVDGPLLVIAGAGSGKTRVVTYRIANLIQQGIPPSSILALTFTNKAAGEMQSRLFELCNIHVLVSTFHSLGAKILRESIIEIGYSPSFTIIDEKDQEKLLKTVFEDLQITDRQMTVKEAKWRLSMAKNDLILPKTFVSESEEDALMQKVYERYQTKLFQYGHVDFDDLLLLPNQIFQEKPEIKKEYQDRWNYLLVDEYQDTNHAQYQLARHIVGEKQNLFVVGDPDQSIYSWRGADIGNILSFEKDFTGAKIIKLEQNYRSTQNILQAANVLIQKNENRYEKKLFSMLGTGELLEVHEFDSDREEARFIARKIQDFSVQAPLREMAIFYRTNSQSRSLEDSLLDQNIPYKIVGNISFYERKEIKDILALLRLITSPNDFIAFERVVKAYKFSLGPKTLEKMRHRLDQLPQSLLALCQELLMTNEIRLNVKQKEGVQRFCDLLIHLTKFEQERKVSELIQEAIIESSYLNILREDPETFEDRKENLDSLLAKAIEAEDQGDMSLVEFLQEITLKTTLDDTEERDFVYLMTLHNAKGLEFDHVFMAGMEEELFPHIHSSESQNIEEERRLCYVGMTRAKKRLFLTWAKRRFLWGQQKIMRPSRFLKEIPKEYLKRHSFYHSFEEEVVYEPLPSEETNFQFEEGDLVFHKEFGNGVIERLFEGNFGPMAEVTFARDRLKRTLALQFAPLQKLS